MSWIHHKLITTTFIGFVAAGAAVLHWVCGR